MVDRSGDNPPHEDDEAQAAPSPEIPDDLTKGDQVARSARWAVDAGTWSVMQQHINGMAAAAMAGVDFSGVGRALTATFSDSPAARAMQARWDAGMQQHINGIAAAAMAGVDFSGIGRALTAGLYRPGAFEGFAELLEKQRRRVLPSNLHEVDVTIEGLSRLADEGITLWAVPDSETAQQFLEAPTYGARREVLARRSRVILDDCLAIAAYAAGGPCAAHARQIERALAAGRAGHVGPAISHLANILDTMMRDEVDSTSRDQLVRHLQKGKPVAMEHFDELTLQLAMVFRPIWFAYRPMYTRERQARSTSFARHAVANAVTGPRILSFRNFVQAAMLATALLNFLSWWSESEANGISLDGPVGFAASALIDRR